MKITLFHIFLIFVQIILSAQNFDPNLYNCYEYNLTDGTYCKIFDQLERTISDPRGEKLAPSKYFQISINGIEDTIDKSIYNYSVKDVMFEDLDNDQVVECIIHVTGVDRFEANFIESYYIYSLNENSIDEIGIIKGSYSMDDGVRNYERDYSFSDYFNEFKVIKIIDVGSEPPYNALPYNYYYFDIDQNKYIAELNEENAAPKKYNLSKFERNYYSSINWLESKYEYSLNDDNINVRDKPTLNSNVIFQVGSSDKVFILDRTFEKYEIDNFGTNFWYRVQTKDGKDGWIFGAFLLLK